MNSPRVPTRSTLAHLKLAGWGHLTVSIMKQEGSLTSSLLHRDAPGTVPGTGLLRSVRHTRSLPRGAPRRVRERQTVTRVLTDGYSNRGRRGPGRNAAPLHGNAHRNWRGRGGLSGRGAGWSKGPGEEEVESAGQRARAPEVSACVARRHGIAGKAL